MGVQIPPAPIMAFGHHNFCSGLLKMQCEVCEKYIAEGKQVRIEGSVVITCPDCARYGEVLDNISSKKTKVQKPQKARENTSFNIEGDSLKDDYARIIHNKRERKNLKQEELAKKINEPASLINKIERGRIKPNLKVAKKLEHILEINLFETKSSEDTDDYSSSNEGDLTLGEVVVIKKKK